MSRLASEPIDTQRPGAVPALRYVIDILLAATPPALLAAESLLRMRGEAFEATLEGIVGLVFLVPWAATLPVVVGLWLYRTGFPSPGQFLTSARPTARKGGVLLDVLLIVAAFFASIPLFYLYELVSSPGLTALLVLAAPVVMTVGTVASFLRLKPSTE